MTDTGRLAALRSSGFRHRTIGVAVVCATSGIAPAASIAADAQSGQANQPYAIAGVLYSKSTPLSGTAAEPLRTGQRTLYRKGQVVRPGGRRIGADMIADWDVPIRLRDGTMIYADLFRPASTVAKMPVIISWSPYGKREGETRLATWPNHGGVPELATSGLQKFEAPDPAYWCARGYAILNPDPPGVGHSQGNITYWGTADALNGHDVVEWAGTQKWSNGRVALAGNSWLAITQWFIAATRPPHLAAIAPWEGISDIYRDAVGWGGIPDDGFMRGLSRSLKGENLTESPEDMIRSYPLWNGYWRSKRADLEKVTVPAYVVASWTNGLHVNGTFRAWQQISSREKWLRVHDTHEWPDLYRYESDLLKFFDRFLKGEQNGWASTPRVRFSILDPGRRNVVDRPAGEFPLRNTQYRRFYLDAARHALSLTPVRSAAKVSYNPLTADGEAAFTFRIDQETDLVGYFTLHTWVQAVGADDMDLFVYVQKVDSSGSLIEPIVDGVTWAGQQGRIRVSHRGSGMGTRSPAVFELDHNTEVRLKPQQIVPIDIPIQPLGMRWRAGDYFKIVIRGSKAVSMTKPGSASGLSPFAPLTMSRNAGMHVIWTGGKYQSWITVPDATTQRGLAKLAPKS